MIKRISQHPVKEVPSQGKKVSFYFDGQEFEGREGEMISSTLMAHGVEIFSLHHQDHAPQGIFCANGQCSQCTALVNGVPQKTCVTPLQEGMRIRTLQGLAELPSDVTSKQMQEPQELEADVLVVGGGPSGIMAALTLADAGKKVILADDKNELGGKLVLQTHKFFGSVKDCYAGTRGYDIAHILQQKVQNHPSIKVILNAAIAGLYSDQKCGILCGQTQYILASFKALLVSSGAREKSLVFPGNTLPGVYGAGAFQTLVNRDMVRASERVWIIGSGNVGLIAAYHALQAGIQVAGICDIAPQAGGYKVHSDKIKRMGVPLYLKTTVLSVQGENKVESVTVAQVDEKYQPLLETARTYAVDTVLVAVGLTPVDDFYELAKKQGFLVEKAGDAEEIAEASSAMMGGQVAAWRLLEKMGVPPPQLEELVKLSEILKSRPGKNMERKPVELNQDWKPLFFCMQEIPCNPCSSICPQKAISLQGEHHNIMDMPFLTGNCIGCGLCVAICPGLAISLARKKDENFAEVVLPWEFLVDFKKGDFLSLTDIDGNFVIKGEVLSWKFIPKYKTNVVTFKVPLEYAQKVIGVRVQEEKVTLPLAEAVYGALPESGIVCRCERVSVKEIVDFIKTHEVRDVNQLKLIRVGMGACGSKTCSSLMPRVFAMAGVDWKEVKKGTIRPLDVEIPLDAVIQGGKV